MDILRCVLEELEDQGIEINYQGKDIDLREYITDSIEFIGFIIGVEERFQTEIPDEMLRYDAISSLHAFAAMIGRLLDSE